MTIKNKVSKPVPQCISELKSYNEKIINFLDLAELNGVTLDSVILKSYNKLKDEAIIRSVAITFLDTDNIAKVEELCIETPVIKKKYCILEFVLENSKYYQLSKIIDNQKSDFSPAKITTFKSIAVISDKNLETYLKAVKDESVKDDISGENANKFCSYSQNQANLYNELVEAYYNTSHHINEHDLL